MMPLFYGLWFRLTCRDNSKMRRTEHESGPTFEARVFEDEWWVGWLFVVIVKLTVDVCCDEDSYFYLWWFIFIYDSDYTIMIVWMWYAVIMRRILYLWMCILSPGIGYVALDGCTLSHLQLIARSFGVRPFTLKVATVLQRVQLSLIANLSKGGPLHEIIFNFNLIVRCIYFVWFHLF